MNPLLLIPIVLALIAAGIIAIEPKKNIAGYAAILAILVFAIIASLSCLFACSTSIICILL